MNIETPVILFFQNILSVDRGDGLKAMEVSFPDESTMVCATSARKGAKDVPGWILEANGTFRELQPKRRRREWASPLSFLIQFVQSEYSVSMPRNITVGELKALVKGVKDEFPEAPLAADLRKFLRKYTDEQDVTAEMLRAWPL